MANIEILNISFKSLKAEIKALQEEMLNLNKESDEYKKKASECAQKQQKLKEVMNDSKKGFAENSEETKNLEGSYNALSKELSKLRKEWKSTNDEAKRQEIGAKMVEINNQLKALDESVGVYSRNVGNYANSFKTALDGIGLSGTKLGATFQTLGAMADGAKNSSIGFKGALDLISKHPILTIVGLLVTIFMKLKDSIAQNEELSNKLSKAMSALNPIFDAVTNAVTWLADKLVIVIDFVMSNLPKVIKVVGNSAESVGNIIANIVDVLMFIPSTMAKVWKSVTEMASKGLTKITDLAASALRAIGQDGAASKLTSTVKSAIDGTLNLFDKFINTTKNAGNAVRGFFSNAKKGADEFAESMSTAQKWQEKEIQLEQDLRKEKELTAQSELKQSQLKIAIAQEKDTKKRIELEKQLRQEIEATGKRQVELARRQKEIAEYNASRTANSKDVNNQLADIGANVYKTEAAYGTQMSTVDRQITRQQKSLDKQSAKQVIDEDAKLLEQWLKQRSDAYKADVENAKIANDSKMQEIADSYAKEYVAISEQYLQGAIPYEEYQSKLADIKQNFDNQKLESEILSNQNILLETENYYNSLVEKMGSGSVQALEAHQKMEEQKLKISQLTNEQMIKLTEQQVKAQQVASNAENKISQNQQRTKDKQLNAYKAFSSTMVKVMGETSDAAKAFAISGAIVDTWRGANAIISQPQNFGPGPVGVALSYIAAAAEVASGLANVANITSESTSGGGVNTPTISYSALNQTPLLNEVTDMQNAQVIASTQPDARVYILESDIQSSNARVNVREVSSEF